MRKTVSRLLKPVRTFIRKGDAVLLALCLTASAYGLLLIYSATRYLHRDRFVYIQLAAVLLGVLVYVVFTFLDFQVFTEKHWRLLLVLSAVLLLLLKTPLGEDYDSGNLNWLVLSRIIPGFPMDLQPNEIIKIPFILVLARQICHIQDAGRDISSVPSVLMTGGFALIVLTLIAVICGDFGMCVIYACIYVTMAWVSGVKLRWFAAAGGLTAGAAVILWLFVLPETKYWTDYRIMRFRVVLDHSLDPRNRGLQQTRSLLAIGSGRIFGQGYLHGTQTQSADSWHLPNRQTDFIFSVCGEELGMAGCILLILILGLIVLRCIWVGKHANSPFSAYVCLGMAGMLLFQILFNIGMCLFILPVMGLTLPFISYGGSSVITLYGAMGIVSSVKAKTLPGWLRDRSNVEE